MPSWRSSQEIDVPPIQVRIECMVSELYADLTVDRETTLLIQNLFGEGITLGGKTDASGSILPAFPGAALRDPAREKFGLKIGVSQGEPGHRFEALVDILVSRGYLKILMNPTLEVVNGQIARIQAKEHVPLQQIFLRGGYGDSSFIETRTEYCGYHRLPPDHASRLRGWVHWSGNPGANFRLPDA